MKKFYFDGSDSSDSGDDNLPYPKPLSRAAFLTPEFDATTFLSSLRNRHQTLEDLRAELRSRSQELDKELLDLVNENYQDFLSLGGSLQGGDERIEEVRLGLLGFRRDVEGLRSKIHDRRIEVQALIAERTKIREKIQMGRTLVELDQRLSQLEENLMFIVVAPAESGATHDLVSSETEDESDDDHGLSLSRLRRHTQQYVCITKMTAKLGTDHPFVQKQQKRILGIQQTLLLDLNTALKQANDSRNENSEKILKLLEIYKDMDDVGEAMKVLKGK